MFDDKNNWSCLLSEEYLLNNILNVMNYLLFNAHNHLKTTTYITVPVLYVRKLKFGKICLTKVTQLVSEVADVWTLAVHGACSFNYSLLRNDSNFNSQQIINFLNAKLWIICLFFLWFVLIPSPYMILLFIVSSISQLAILRNWSTASSYVSTAPFLIVAAL